MAACIVRLICCPAALLVSSVVFWGRGGLMPVVAGGVILALLYIFIRPLLQILLIPFNIVLAGIFTPLTDAWLVLWAGAWSGAGWTYPQAVFTAVLIILFYLPYSRSRKEKLLGNT